MINKTRVVNYKLRAFMSEFGLTDKDLADIINKTPNAVSKKINNKKFTQEEMQMLLVKFRIIDRHVDMNIFA